MAKPKTVDPRLELVNFDVLDMDKFPPVEEWTEDDYEEAGLLTLAAMAVAEREELRALRHGSRKKRSRLSSDHLT